MGDAFGQRVSSGRARRAARACTQRVATRARSALARAWSEPMGALAWMQNDWRVARWNSPTSANGPAADSEPISVACTCADVLAPRRSPEKTCSVYVNGSLAHRSRSND
jgi:hypothetical protein